MTQIIGTSKATAKQMSQYLLSKNSSPKFSRNISAIDFCNLFLNICKKEDVRGDIAFAQACKETGYFKYGGDVKYTQNNFAGIGATGGITGCIFKDIETGILAQAQHLKSYATKEPLNQPNVDPRRTTWFVSAKGGTSPNVETLGGTWAVPGYSTNKYSSLIAANKAKDSYGYQIVEILNDILSMKKEEITSNINKIKGDEIMIKIALDAGHGLFTSGKRCLKSLDKNETREWFLNDRIMDKVESKLKAYNCTTIRVDDTTGAKDISLSNRVKLANNEKADVYISMHHNAGLNGRQGGGTGVYYYSSKSERKVQANALYNAIIKETGLVGNRGLKVINKGFYVIKNTNMAAFLVENGFMDSPSDVPIIISDAHAEKTANGVVNFLIAQYKLTKKTGITTTISTTTVNPSTTTSTSFIVRCLEDLNIRQTPGGNIVAKNGCKRNLKYTITKVSGNWGRLKSGAGWICISSKYVTKC